MMWPFTKKENPVLVLESLRSSLEKLTERFERKELSNEVYLEKALRLQKDIAKYEKKARKFEQN